MRQSRLDHAMLSATAASAKGTILDETSPEITLVKVTSTAAVGDTYRIGEHIEITVTFD